MTDLNPENGDGLGFRTADGLFAVDAEQRICEWNAMAGQVLGYSREQVIGRPCYEVIAGADPQSRKFCRRDCPVIVNARRGRVTPHYDVLSHHQNGAMVWLDVTTLVPEPERGATPWRVFHMFRDVTLRRNLEERARRALAALQAVDTAKNGVAASEEQDGFEMPVPQLSPRERDVLHLLALGLSTQQIGESLGITRITARNHICRLLVKLGVENRLQAVIYAAKRGLM